jgi:hypothetical protein
VTVSPTATQDYTVDQIIALSMVTAGLLNPAHLHSPPAAELEVGRQWLFFRLQSMTNSGLVLRARERVTVATTAAVAYVDAAADTLSIEKNIVIRDTAAGTDRPLDVINEMQYQAVSTKTQAGAPVQAFVEQLLTGIWRIHLWPVPDGTVAWSVIYPRTRRLRDVEPGSVTLDLGAKHYQHIMLYLSQRYAAAKGRKDSQAMLASESGIERTIAENDETTRGDSHFVAAELDIFG